MKRKKTRTTSLELLLPEIGKIQWGNWYARGKNTRWIKREWWNGKLYLRRPEPHLNDGFLEQIDLYGNREVPYKRDVFYPRSVGRFNLPGEPIAYFAEDFATMCCETIRSLRDKEDLTFYKDLDPYLSGKADLHPDYTGYPRSYKLHRDVILLDLSRPTHPLIGLIEDEGPWPEEVSFYSDILQSRDQAVSYKVTEQIAVTAVENGFDGIIYESVRSRMPDMWMPSTNLIIFNPEKISRRGSKD